MIVIDPSDPVTIPILSPALIYDVPSASCVNDPVKLVAVNFPHSVRFDVSAS